VSINGMSKSTSGGVTTYSWNVFDPWKEHVRAVITTRGGGFSEKPFDTLNLGHLVDDKPEAIKSNRALTAASLSVPEAAWAVANQVHKTRIGVVNQFTDRPYDACDALLISKTGVIAAILLADCLPVMVYDSVSHKGIVCHAGWRGTAAGIARIAVERLLNDGGRVENIIAATGPGIGPCCYPVGDEVANEFKDSFDYPENVVIRDSGGGYRINLEEANLARLRAIGIKEENLGAAGFCTACRSDEFFSYRKERGLTGRHAALMVLF
jgi:YfiH family protein